VPHQQAGHMTEADQIVRNVKKELANRGRPHMTVPITNAVSRSRGATRPSSAFISRPHGGRGECRVPVAPAASCALCIGRTHTSNNEYTGIARHSRTQWFYGLCRALPGDRAVLPPSSADMFCLSPVGPTQLRELDASVGASGPHDFAVREKRLSSARRGIAQESFDSPCDPIARKTLPRPPHPHPASVTIAIRPSGGVGWREFVEMICPTRLGKNSDYRAGVARSVTTANHSAMLAWNAFKTSGIERRAEPRPLSRATRAFSAMYATKRSKPRMLSMRVKL
jgi:hypothetical protein